MTPLHLIAALLIVAGLAFSAPPSCVCAPDDHFGLLLHPLFPHVHGAQHSPLTFSDGAAAETAMTVVDQAPGISAAATGNGAHDAIAGLLLAALLLAASRRVALMDARPEQRAVSPPIPPPRLVPSII